MTMDLDTIGRTLKLNAPMILTAVGVSGVIGSSILTARGAIHAQRDIWEAESERLEPLTKKEIVKLTWVRYAPAALVMTTTVACIVGAQYINGSRQAALAGAVAIGERMHREFREKAEEVIGEKKVNAIQDEVAKDSVTKSPPPQEVILKNPDDALIKDAYTGRYFTGTIDGMHKAVNEFNALTLGTGYALLNDFYELLGLPRVDIGDEMGWRAEKLLEIQVTSTMYEDRPIAVMTFRTAPMVHPYSPF